MNRILKEKKISNTINVYNSGHNRHCSRFIIPVLVSKRYEDQTMKCVRCDCINHLQCLVPQRGQRLVKFKCFKCTNCRKNIMVSTLLVGQSQPKISKKSMNNIQVTVNGVGTQVQSVNTSVVTAYPKIKAVDSDGLSTSQCLDKPPSTIIAADDLHDFSAFGQCILEGTTTTKSDDTGPITAFLDIQQMKQAMSFYLNNPNSEVYFPSAGPSAPPVVHPPLTSWLGDDYLTIPSADAATTQDGLPTDFRSCDIKTLYQYFRRDFPSEAAAWITNATDLSVLSSKTG